MRTRQEKKMSYRHIDILSVKKKRLSTNTSSQLRLSLLSVTACECFVSLFWILNQCMYCLLLGRNYHDTVYWKWKKRFTVSLRKTLVLNVGWGVANRSLDYFWPRVAILIFVNKYKNIENEAISQTIVHSFEVPNSAINCFEICLVFSYVLWVFLLARPYFNTKCLFGIVSLIGMNHQISSFRLQSLVWNSVFDWHESSNIYISTTISDSVDFKHLQC
jgi:hypothetical protein